MDCFEDTAHPRSKESIHRGVGDPEFASRLDRALYTAPYVLIAEDNTSPRRVKELDRAYAAIRDGRAATAGGTLRDGVLAADIDPDPADAVLAEACAEILVRWCVERGLPYVVRASGRPGGLHVLAHTTSSRHTRGWNSLCEKLGRRLGVPIDNRTGGVLRLLSAPHRHGYSAAVLGGTMSSDITLAAGAAEKGHHPPMPSRRRLPTRKVGKDTTRSAKEFGAACALRRKGYRAQQVWKIQAVPGSKAIERGEHNWRRFVWLDVVTTVAAEQKATEDVAWQQVCGECPAICRKLGRPAWRRRYWTRARIAAETTRPRRRRAELPAQRTPPATRDRPKDEVQTGLLRAAFDAALGRLKIRPNFARSCRAFLHALAGRIVSNEGYASVRQLAEIAHIDTKTVQACSKRLIEAGLISRRHRYSGGAVDSDAYEVGAVVPRFDQGGNETSPTSPKDTPAAPTRGAANVSLLRRRFRLERRHWRARCSALASLGPGETLRTSTHPAVKAYRSLRFQLRWWHSQSPAEQEDRRQARRRELSSRLTRAARSVWFDWLGERAAIVDAVNRVGAGSGTVGDFELLAKAPRTIHLGLNDPLWQASVTRSTQLSLAA